MNRTRIRNLAMASMPMAFLLLAADLHTPGYGTFANPVFYVRWASSWVTSRGDAATPSIEADDPRLALCQGAIDASAIDASQTALRKVLAGESETVAVSLLGAPACRLADDSFRWLTEEGLALDVQLGAYGEVVNAKLNRH